MVSGIRQAEPGDDRSRPSRPSGAAGRKKQGRTPATLVTDGPSDGVSAGRGVLPRPALAALSRDAPKPGVLLRITATPKAPTKEREAGRFDLRGLTRLTP
jgi:hypothetical protein